MKMAANRKGQCITRCNQRQHDDDSVRMEAAVEHKALPRQPLAGLWQDLTGCQQSTLVCE